MTLEKIERAYPTYVDSAIAVAKAQMAAGELDDARKAFSAALAAASENDGGLDLPDETQERQMRGSVVQPRSGRDLTLMLATSSRRGSSSRWRGKRPIGQRFGMNAYGTGVQPDWDAVIEALKAPRKRRRARLTRRQLWVEYRDEASPCQRHRRGCTGALRAMPPEGARRMWKRSQKR